MEIIRSRTHRFNMGPYEHVETSATVTVDTEELGLDLTDPVKAVNFVNDCLDSTLQEDIDRAAQSTGNDDTYLHAWKELTE